MANKKFEKFKRISGKTLFKLLELQENLKFPELTEQLGTYSNEKFEENSAEQGLNFCQIENINEEIEKVVNQVFPPLLDVFVNPMRSYFLFI